MDSAVRNAITAVSLADDSTAQRWFDTVCASYQALDQRDWDSFTSALTNLASSAGVDPQTVEQFVQQMSSIDSTPLDTVGRLVDLGSELPTLYQQLTAPTSGRQGQSAQDGQAATPTGYDEGVWQSFLSQNGPYWNGEDTAWDQFRTWFLYQADQQQLTEPAAGFIAYVEGQQDKRSAFAQYGIQIATSTVDPSDTGSNSDGAAQQTPDVSTFPEIRPGDSGEWVDYLDTMLRSNGF